MKLPRTAGLALAVSQVAGTLAAPAHRNVWKYETVPQHGTKRAYRSGKVLGGGSSINAVAYVRGQIRDYPVWQDAVGDIGKWSHSGPLPVFMTQEDNDTFQDEHHGIDGGLAVQQPKGINKLNQYCLKAFQEYGGPCNPDYNGKSQMGVSPVQSTVGNQRRCSAADACLRPHPASGRVTIGPAEKLFRHGIAVIVDSPEVGENLEDHPMVPVRAYVKGDLSRQAAARGLGTVKAGLRYLVTEDGPAAGIGIETVTHCNPSDFTADPTIQCSHVPIIATEGFAPTGDRLASPSNSWCFSPKAVAGCGSPIATRNRCPSSIRTSSAKRKT